jgi:hypothetical protein
MGGGGGGGGGQTAQMIASAPVPTPAPPVTSNNASVQQAEQDMAQQNLLQKSVKKTILAGDTGGYLPTGKNAVGQPNPITAYKTKLG